MEHDWSDKVRNPGQKQTNCTEMPSQNHTNSGKPQPEHKSEAGTAKHPQPVLKSWSRVEGENGPEKEGSRVTLRVRCRGLTLRSWWRRWGARGRNSSARAPTRCSKCPSRSISSNPFDLDPQQLVAAVLKSRNVHPLNPLDFRPPT
eukprot:3210211-Rhodomonas_salina.1